MGKLYVVGIGPGSEEKMTIEARDILLSSEVIVGYTKYIELIRGIEGIEDKELIETGMRGEVERCTIALEKAQNSAKQVCMICSGDAGIYGMAGIVLELSVDYKDVDIEIIPGVSAALSGSALLGAAIGHDTAIISLSDLLTPWELIEKRLRAAVVADFCIALYNPSSRTRADYLKKACEIILESVPGDRVCGVARNIGREGESITITDLNTLKDMEVDMFSTVFIGNSKTVHVGKYMVTPRGYLER